MDYLSFSQILQCFININAAVLNALFKAYLISCSAKDINAGKSGNRICYCVIYDIAVAVGLNWLIERNIDSAKPDQGIAARLTESVAVLSYCADRTGQPQIR